MLNLFAKKEKHNKYHLIANAFKSFANAEKFKNQLHNVL